MLDCPHQVYAFGRPRLRFILHSLLPSSMVCAVRFDKENQRITLLHARVNFCGLSSLTNLHAPVVPHGALLCEAAVLSECSAEHYASFL
jgi:hypothetical protein